MTTLRLLYTLSLRLAGTALLVVTGILACARLGLLDAGDAPLAPVWALVTGVAFGLFFVVPRLQPYGMRRPGRRTDVVWILPHSAVASLAPFLAVPFAALPFVPPSSLTFDPNWIVILPALLLSALVVPNVRRGGRRADRAGKPDRRAHGTSRAGSAFEPGRAIPAGDGPSRPDRNFPSSA